jgi:hypothetical protein
MNLNTGRPIGPTDQIRLCVIGSYPRVCLGPFNIRPELVHCADEDSIVAVAGC